MKVTLFASNATFLKIKICFVEGNCFQETRGFRKKVQKSIIALFLSFLDFYYGTV